MALQYWQAQDRPRRQRLLTLAGALDAERIMGVETGGCPHTAIRDDTSMNMAAIAELQLRPKTTVRLDEEKPAQQVLKLVEMLEDHDDVNSVFANFDIPDQLLEALADVLKRARINLSHEVNVERLSSGWPN